MSISNKILEEAGQTLDIPPSAYEKAASRYKSLYEWLIRPESNCRTHKPHVYSQGSFRLGTIIRPLDRDGSYDLDLGCRLNEGISKMSHTQEQLKKLVGDELEAYRKAKGFSNKLDEKNRCWRLHYADEPLCFHMDAVPSIPEDATTKGFVKAAMIKEGVDQRLAGDITSHAGAITDRTEPNYRVLDWHWHISNSEGYALWFRSRMRQATQLLEARAKSASVAKIDDLPDHEWKTPLQRCIQLLKRHRDVLYSEDDDAKPISIIITTLAAHAYNGESDLADALTNILEAMESLVRATAPRVPNPVNPAEDFADKWHKPDGYKLQLEPNFRKWVRIAKADFKAIINCRDAAKLSELLESKLGCELSTQFLNEKIGFGPPAIATPRVEILSNNNPRPWLK